MNIPYENESYQDYEDESYQENENESNQEHENESNQEPQNESYLEHENESSEDHENDSYQEHENESYEDHENDSYQEHENESYQNHENDSYQEHENESYQDHENESDPEHDYESDPDRYRSNKKSLKKKKALSKLDKGLTGKIRSIIEQIKKPGAFAYSAIDSSLPNPGLHVPPHGTLGLPLSSDDAQKIISQASQSPFGRGEKTLIDTTVRKSWELNPNQFSLLNPLWNKAIETIVDTVTTALGLDKTTGKVSAELYKLLLYEPGAFFKPHKDSEKAPGMFATLVVCLPSPHKGGKLVMTHENDKHEFETASSPVFSCSYAAWYSDITHEVLPVVSGYRLVLTYNLVRQTGSEIPSYDSVCGRGKQLSTLLKQYNLQLEKGDKLSPMLLYKLEHKYSQANLKLNKLKPPDLAQVQMLQQVATELGFDIYLAVSELELNKDDEYEDSDIEERTQRLKNIVELDGKLVAESIDYPEGMDPLPQEKRKADEEDHQVTGNEGAPATYWYRDTVVVLVPPSKQLNFIFKFNSDGTLLKPLFFKLMKKLSSDPAEKPKLERLCELALKQKIKTHHYFGSRSDDSIPPYFQQAVVTALELGRMDLFDEACKSTKDQIILDNACLLGRWAADHGMVSMKYRLMKGVVIASSIAKKLEFLIEVAEGFKTAKQKPSSADREIFKQWSNKAVFDAVAHLTTLTEADAKSLAQLCKTVDWSQFELQIKPVIMNLITMTKITFIDELMSTLQQELNEQQRSFIEVIIRSIWNKFVFDVKCHKSEPQTSSYSHWGQSSSSKNGLKRDDILLIVEKTLQILSPKSVETTIIPAMLNAIPAASKESTKEVFILIVQMILKKELAGFKLSAKDAVPLSHKCLVQALLTKFVKENVPAEPQAPANWSLPPRRACECKDCAVINKFLQDPHEQSLDFPCSLTRSRHLQSKFKVSLPTSLGSTDNQSSFDIQTIGERTPVIWRITKHHGAYEKAKYEWSNIVGGVTQTLSKLEKVKAVKGRLEAYLQPYYSAIMNANIKELPDLKSLIAMPQSTKIDENVAPAQNQPKKQTGHKRKANNGDLPEDGLVKKTKT